MLYLPNAHSDKLGNRAIPRTVVPVLLEQCNTVCQNKGTKRCNFTILATFMVSTTSE